MLSHPQNDLVYFCDLSLLEIYTLIWLDVML